ncbi:Signal transduction histidine-protein kinase BarA [compost metagenome]
MDLQMPEMDGYTATMEIRKLPGAQYQRLPIIALTAAVMTEIKEEVLLAGMNDFLAKPFNPDDLYAKISRYHHI